MAKAKPAVSASPFPDWDPERAEDMFKIWEYQPNLHLASTMQQYAGYDDTLGQDGARPPLLIGGRRWWAALGRLSSALALTLAVVVELMFVMRDASADVSSLSANTGSTPHADVPTDDTASQASDVSSSSGASEDAGDDYLGDADYLYYDEADGKYYEDDGSGSSVKRRLGRLLVRQIANAASETAKQQKKNSTASIDASSAGNSSSTNATAGAASGNSTDVCQWVTDTDVQNSGAGVPLAVSFHLLTESSAGILVIAVLAEIHIFRRQLHASAMLNVGVVQLWVGLGILSRSFDLFGELAGYAMMLAGLGNLVFGTMARFEIGGPGAALFATAKAPTPEQYAEQQAQLIAAAGSPSGQQGAAGVGQAAKGDPAAPTPYSDEKEAMKEVQKLAEAAKTQTALATAQDHSSTAALSAGTSAYGLGANGLLTPGLTATGAQQPQFVLPNPTDNSGYDAGMPLLNQLALTNPMLQRQVLQALSTPGGVTYASNGGPSLLDDGTAPAVPPPHLMGPYAGVMPQMAAASSEAGSSRSRSSHRHHKRKFKHSGRS